MATDCPDILEQALAEVGPYIDTDAGAAPYISTQTENIVQDVQTLCTKLAGEGEETLFISVNVSGNQCAYLGSTLGKDFIEKNKLVQGFFSYCNDKYESRISQSSSQVKTPNTSVPVTSGNLKGISQQPGNNQISKQPGFLNLATQTPGNKDLLQTPGLVSLATQQQGSEDLLKKPDSQGFTKQPGLVNLATQQQEQPTTLSQVTGNTLNQGLCKMSNSKPSTPQTTLPVTPHVPVYRSLLSKSGKFSGPVNSQVRQPKVDQKEESPSLPSDSTTLTNSEKTLDKSVSADLPDEEEEVPVSKSSNPKKSKDGKSEEVLVLIQPKDSKSKESILVYKTPDESQKVMMKKRGRPRKSVAGDANSTVTGEITKTPNTQTQTKQGSAEPVNAKPRSPGYVTKRQTRNEAPSVPSPNGRSKRQTAATSTPSNDSKGPFHMRTRSGGKAKHMPWLNKWKDKDDFECNDTETGKGKSIEASPERKSTSGNKRKASMNTGDVRKKIKVEVKSDDEDADDSQDGGLAVRKQVNQSTSDLDDSSSKQNESEDMEVDDAVKDAESEIPEKGILHDDSINITDESSGDNACRAVTDEEEDTIMKDGVDTEELTARESDDQLDTDSSEKHDIQNLREDDDDDDDDDEDDDEDDNEESKSEDVHQCDTCGKKLETSVKLKVHEKIHTSGQYVCDVCGKCYLQERALLRHTNQVHRSKLLPCTECDEVFKNQRQRDEHLAIKHNIPTIIKCKSCDETFKDYKELRSHAKSHVVPCVCEYCGKSFPRRTDLVMHRRVHTKEKPIKCNVCGRGFARASTLLSHKLTHRNYNAFQCEVCGRTFKTKESMRQHRKVHMKESTVPCDHCEQKFRTFDGVKNHIIQCHPEIAPPEKWFVYTCDKCHKRFGGKQQYIRHMSVHTGVRPHECNLCGKSYPTVGALNTHKKTHKECMPTRQFHCNVCNHHFGILSKMKRHMETAKHIQYCMAVGVDPMGNLREYEAKIAAEGNTRAHAGGVQVPADGSMPIVIKNEIPELVDYEGDETVECVLIHLPDDEVALQDGAQIVYSINTEDGTIESVFHETAPKEETVTTEPAQ